MESFECPSCGAALTLDGNSDALVECPYCGKSAVIPDHLRSRPSGETVSKVKFTQEGVQVEIQSSEYPTAQAFSVEPSDQPVTQTKGLTRWVTCAAVLIGIGILGSIVLAVIIPQLTKGAMESVIKDVTSPTTQVEDIQALIQTPLAQLTQEVTKEPEFAAQVLAFGEEGTGVGRFEDTRWVGVDGEGNIFTAEYQDGRVQKFDPQGKFLLSWNVGDEHVITDLAVNRQGVVYVVTGGQMLKFDGKDGKPMGSVQGGGDRYFESLEVTVDNGLVVMADGEDILRFDADEQFMWVVEDAISSVTGDSELDSRVAVDGLGKVYVLATFNEGIFVFSAEGKYQNRIGSRGDAPGQFRAPNDLAVDGQGRLFISDIFGIQVFTPDGRFLDTFPVDGVAFGLDFDDSNHLLAASNAQRILKFEINQ